MCSNAFALAFDCPMVDAIALAFMFDSSAFDFNAFGLRLIQMLLICIYICNR